MKSIGAVVLSFEETGDLAGLAPWKSIDVDQLYHSLSSRVAVSGFLHLSTCNRVEFIYSLHDATKHVDFAVALMASLPPLNIGIQPSFYQGREALRHLIRLSCGLESMVLGETEIRAQLKDAIESKSNRLDVRLRVLFRSIFQESREIRSNLPLNHLPLSVATLAVKKVTRWIGLDPEKALLASAHEIEELRKVAHLPGDAGNIVIIGSGPMSRQSAEYLAKWSDRLVMVNRTVEKVQPIAERIGARVLSFQEFIDNPDKVGPVSAVITATSVGRSFIDKEFAIRLLSVREQSGSSFRPLLLVDLAVPADVAPNVAELADTKLISMDTLRAELEHNRQKRNEAAAAADPFIEHALYAIEANLIASISGPILREIQKEVREKSREKLEDLLELRLGHLSAKDKRLLYSWAIQANKDMNRIHRTGIESVLRNYFAQNENPSDLDMSTAAVSAQKGILSPAEAEAGSMAVMEKKNGAAKAALKALLTGEQSA